MHETNYNDLVNIVRLIRSENVGPITFFKLIEKFGDFKEAIDSIPSLVKNAGKNKINIFSESMAKKEIDLHIKNNVKIITYKDSFYPPLLKKIEDRPPLIFCKGNLQFLKKISVAIVGSRNASLLGRNTSFKIAKELSENGFLVVSGLAKGIDREAHLGAINKGTVAFLGGGIDSIYPLENKELFAEIEEKGALISEYPIGSKVLVNNFPRRNRLISGMSRGVLVVEANLTSGSIITAKYAIEQGREVFAIPSHPNDSRNLGCNYLIKNGAILVEQVSDIVEVLKNNNCIMEDLSDNMLKVKNTKIIDDEILKKARQKIDELIGSSPIEIENLVDVSGFGYEIINQILLELELCGKIERFPNNKIAKCI
jgi:DNA processing protein